MAETPVIALEQVLDQRYMTAPQAQDLLGLAKQTLHNKVSDGSAPCRPVGKLRFGRTNKNIWLRSDIEQWARRRGRYT